MNFRERNDELMESAAYRNYVTARDAAEKMLDRPVESLPAIAMPSDYWAEELAGFEYVFDASPLLVDKLRHHTYHITGVYTYTYRTGANPDGHINKLRMLQELPQSPGLFVPESPVMGGFGHVIDGDVVNADTLKFYESMIALDKSGLLSRFRDEGDRKVVLEIGSGWGGLAYVYKTVMPNTTCVLVDFPQLFIFSASYLMTLFPEARVLFVTEVEDLPADVREYDFVFVPNFLFDRIHIDNLELTLNTVSFQEMTDEQVRWYVGKVASMSCRHLYSLNRNRSLYATQLDDIYPIMSDYYDLEHVTVLALPYSKFFGKPEKVKGTKGDKPAKVKKPNPEKEAKTYRHVLGTLRK